jgi:hypothetical protein
MVVYPLTCAAGHAFEGWYASPEAFERQRGAGHLECPACGAREVSKLPSAPYVHTAASAPAAPVVTPAERAQILASLKSLILAGTENVGPRFAEVALRMHRGEECERAIRGRATREEAEQLREEGVEALALPSELRLDDATH